MQQTCNTHLLTAERGGCLLSSGYNGDNLISFCPWSVPIDAMAPIPYPIPSIHRPFPDRATVKVARAC